MGGGGGAPVRTCTNCGAASAPANMSLRVAVRFHVTPSRDVAIPAAKFSWLGGRPVMDTQTTPRTRLPPGSPRGALGFTLNQSAPFKPAQYLAAVVWDAGQRELP
jgi:hypothetical protein